MWWHELYGMGIVSMTGHVDDFYLNAFPLIGI